MEFCGHLKMQNILVDTFAIAVNELPLLSTLGTQPNADGRQFCYQSPVEKGTFRTCDSRPTTMIRRPPGLVTRVISRKASTISKEY